MFSCIRWCFGQKHALRAFSGCGCRRSNGSLHSTGRPCRGIRRLKVFSLRGGHSFGVDSAALTLFAARGVPCPDGGLVGRSSGSLVNARSNFARNSRGQHSFARSYPNYDTILLSSWFLFSGRTLLFACDQFVPSQQGSLWFSCSQLEPSLDFWFRSPR